ncbi:MAG: NAD-dependent epimerase/dehydratase family protein [Flavobacteriales bacterium]|nr:NAD-dependent epimerase/dehydratase family protein [Flavobacteriales bacterium]MBL6869984.1 NAD-dependent epimerase/dehydratase family protein [Flavobacteriales bacterium]
MGKKLVIGSSGQIGVELIEQLAKDFGPNQVIAADIKLVSEGKTLGVEYITLDVLDKEKLFEIIKQHNISEVYLLAAMLSAIAEKNIQLAWDLNMKGLFNILDLAKEKHIEKIFWPSSIAVFGPTSPKLNTPQTTLLEPSTVYGISKMSGERWCEYYFLKYGVDVRSLRYPGIISYKSPPGGGTTDYAIEIFHAAINDGFYDSFIAKEVTLPMVYMQDAIRATMEIMQVERKKLTINSSYNLAAISFSPEEIANEIKLLFPEFQITYNPDFRNNIALSWPSVIDDSFARNDWGWEHNFDLKKTTLEMVNGIKN